MSRSAEGGKTLPASTSNRSKMDDLELFDVFNVDNNPEPEQKTIQGLARDKPKRQKTSKHEKSIANDESANGVSGKRSYDQVSTAGGRKQEDDGGESTTVTKRLRKMAENPIIVDSFETETDQIVPATQGLQGAARTDQNIIIKKRVIFHFHFSCAEFVHSIVMQRCFQLQTGSILLLNHITLQIHLLEYTHSNWIPFKRCRLQPSNGMKVCLSVHIHLLGKRSLQNTQLPKV
jgi:hypothetical protein